MALEPLTLEKIGARSVPPSASLLPTYTSSAARWFQYHQLTGGRVLGLSCCKPLTSTWGLPGLDLLSRVRDCSGSLSDCQDLHSPPWSCHHSVCPKESSHGNCAALSLRQGMFCQVLGCHLKPCPGPSLLARLPSHALPSNLDFQWWLFQSLVCNQALSCEVGGIPAGTGD